MGGWDSKRIANTKEKILTRVKALTSNWGKRGKRNLKKKKGNDSIESLGPDYQVGVMGKRV